MPILSRVRRSAPPSCLFVLGLSLAALGLSAPEVGAQSVEPVDYRPPVDAPIADSFRPPAHPFGPGNRGLEYDTVPGSEVRASADGQVVFAGPVAGSLHVTVRHGDGVRTSYSFLERIAVVTGQRVHQGEPVGTAGEQLHFGARRGDAYFDPATLFEASGPVEVELLPFEVPPGATADQERTALLELAVARSGHAGFRIGPPSLADVARWAVDRARLAQHYARRLDPVVQAADLTAAIAGRLAHPPPCTDDPAPRHPAAAGPDRVAVLVGGLGSSSRSASIDRLRTGDLGYQRRDVVRFSYTGGRTPDSTGDLPGVEARPYTSADTQGDLASAARRLADLVEAAARDRPGALVDLYGHSMGGVVARLALEELDRRGFDLARLGLVATFGAPHHGAALATAVAAANRSPLGNLGLDLAPAVRETGLDPDRPAIRQLSETSAVATALADRPVPDGVELLSLGASGDVVVAAPDTEVPGARNVTVSLTGRRAHGDLVASEEATAEVARALAGRPPRCEDPWEVVREQLTGHAVAYAEDLGGFAVLLAS